MGWITPVTSTPLSTPGTITRVVCMSGVRRDRNGGVAFSAGKRTGRTASSAKLVGLARHPEEVPGAVVGARHARGLAVTADRSERSRLAIVKRRPGTKARTERRVCTREVRRRALVEPKIATQIRSRRAGPAVLIDPR